MSKSMPFTDSSGGSLVAGAADAILQTPAHEHNPFAGLYFFIPTATWCYQAEGLHYKFTHSQLGACRLDSFQPSIDQDVEPWQLAFCLKLVKTLGQASSHQTSGRLHVLSQARRQVGGQQANSQAKLYAVLITDRLPGTSWGTGDVLNPRSILARPCIKRMADLALCWLMKHLQSYQSCTVDLCTRYTSRCVAHVSGQEPY